MRRIQSGKITSIRIDRLQTGRVCCFFSLTYTGIWMHTHAHTHKHMAHSRGHGHTGFVCIHSFTHWNQNWCVQAQLTHTHTVYTKPKQQHPCYFCSFRINLMDRMSGGITTDWWNQDTKCNAERDTLHCITQGICTQPHNTHKYTKIDIVANTDACKHTCTHSEIDMHLNNLDGICFETYFMAICKSCTGNQERYNWIDIEPWL